MGLHDETDRSDGDPFVHDGYAVFDFKPVRFIDKPKTVPSDLLIDIIGKSSKIAVNTILQIDSKGCRSDIKILTKNHVGGFKYFFGGYGHVLHPVHHLKDILVLNLDLHTKPVTDLLKLFTDFFQTLF